MIVLWLFLACTAPEPAPPHALSALATHILAQTDTDHDGQISQAEYVGAAFPDEPLRTYDLNTDNALDHGELVKMLQDTDPARQQNARRQRRQSGSQP